MRRRDADRLARGLCRSCNEPAIYRRDCEHHRAIGRATQARRHAEVRLQVINGYGGRCACCGEAEPRFLTIDHANDDGNVRRREAGSNEIGRALYGRLVRQGFPPEYRLQCFNCNAGRALNGGRCPHEARLLVAV